MTQGCAHVIAALTAVIVLAANCRAGAVSPKTTESTAFDGAAIASTREIYELQERCSKRAEEVFKDDGRVTRAGNGQPVVFDFENHFSLILQKCFALETTLIFPTHKASKGKEQAIVAYFLLDVNEHRSVASFMKVFGTKAPTAESRTAICFVDGKKCQSEDEFRALIKPYMEQ